ncbi:MAG: RsmD family RNA methyltransferase [Pseudonocardia sp.]
MHVAPAATVLARPAPAAHDIVLVDPPYDVPDAEIAGWLADAAAHGWLAPHATVVVERGARSGRFPWPQGYVSVRERRYGDTVLHVARR